MKNKLRAWDEVSFYEFDLDSIDRGYIMTNNSPLETSTSPGFSPISKMTLMRPLGFTDKDGKVLFEGDICEFTKTNDGFERSNAGEFMTKFNVDKIIIQFEISEHLALNYRLWFSKGGIPLKDIDALYKPEDLSQLTEKDIEEAQEIYAQYNNDLNFIKYLFSKNNIVLLGNIFENSELVVK